MNSTIRLYYGNAERPWELFEERNFVIEDIADYLKQYPYLERQDFMHQKLRLDMSIKVDIGQEYMNPLYETAIRYVSITPDEEDKTYYFYVEECNWLSRKAVQLSIHMDTLNTFKYNSYENGYILSGGTHITRQHKDRFNNEITLIDLLFANEFSIKDISNLSTLDTYLNTYVALSGTGTTVETTGMGVINNIGGTVKITATGTYNGVEYVTGFEIYHCDVSSIDLVSDDNVYEIDCWEYENERQSLHAWVFDGSIFGFCYAEADDNTGTDTTVHFNITGEWLTVEEFKLYFKAYFDTMALRMSGTGDLINIITDSVVNGDIEGTEIRGKTFTSSSATITFNTDDLDEETADTLISATTFSIRPNFENSAIITITGTCTTSFFTEQEERLQRNIDYYPEQLDIPVYLTDEELVVDKNIDENWYLIIANQNNPDESTENPVNYFLCCDEEIQVAGIDFASEQFEMSFDELFEKTGASLNVYLWLNDKTLASYITPYDDVMKDYLKDYVNRTLLGTTWGTEITITRISGKYTFKMSYMASNGLGYNYEIADVTKLEWYYPLTISYSASKNSSRIEWTTTKSGTITPDDAKTITKFEDINRTDSKLIKIVLLPYRPFNCSIENEIIIFPKDEYEQYTYAFDETTTYSLIRVKTDDLSSNIITNLPDPINDTLLDVTLKKDDLFDITSGSKSYDIESKMYNSDFYYKKLVYDSFNFSYHLEMLYPTDELVNFSFTFSMTKTGNSRFMFTYDLPWKFADIDYPNVMPVTRNNEMPLFNNAYLDYVRTGYNYDVKNKTLHNANDWVSLFTQTAKGTAGAVEMNSYSNAIQGVGMGATMKASSTIINAVGGAISNALQMQIRENNLQKNVIEKQWQTSSIYGSDDVDLLKKYTGNRMKMVTYEINEQFKKLVLALFHYTGYKCNEFGVPDVSTRTRFNYVQADIVLDSMMNFSSEIKQELIGRWAGGVYFIHHYNNEWDCQLKYENYEVSLEEYIG